MRKNKPAKSKPGEQTAATGADEVNFWEHDSEEEEPMYKTENELKSNLM